MSSHDEGSDKEVAAGMASLTLSQDEGEDWGWGWS